MNTSVKIILYNFNKVYQIDFNIVVFITVFVFWVIYIDDYINIDEFE